MENNGKMLAQILEIFGLNDKAILCGN